jgi:hypothetical protein
VILHGSLAAGGFVSGHSDIDVLVVVERSLGADELRDLERLLTRWVEAGPEEADVRVVTRAAAAAPTPSPPMELYVGLLLKGLEVERRVDEPDLVPEFAHARASGLALLGEPPSALIGDVPKEWLVSLGDRYLARWQQLTDDDDRAELMVLTACRIWRFAAEGVHCSKADAGAWALVRDPELEAVRGALQRHSGEPAAISPADIAELLRRVRAELAL